MAVFLTEKETWIKKEEEKWQAKQTWLFVRKPNFEMILESVELNKHKHYSKLILN